MEDEEQSHVVNVCRVTNGSSERMSSESLAQDAAHLNLKRDRQIFMEPEQVFTTTKRREVIAVHHQG